MRRVSVFRTLVLIAGLPLAALAAGPARLAAQPAVGSAITYQGSLNDAGTPASGLYDLQFMLFDDAVAGTQMGGTITEGGETSSVIGTTMSGVMPPPPRTFLPASVYFVSRSLFSALSGVLR